MKFRPVQNKQQALEKLSFIAQEHLLDFWNTLSPHNQQILLKEIDSLDIDLFFSQKEALKQKNQSVKNYSPLDVYSVSSDGSDEEFGKELAAKGKVACVVLAGGQGSRLGFKGPKGCFPLTIIKKKSLYQLIAERIKAASKLVGYDLFCAIMVSPLNHKQTEKFFLENDFFGLKKEQVTFFLQKMWPMLDFQGNLFLEEPNRIASGPNGNGDIFRLLCEVGIYDAWKERGVESVNIIPVDNALALPFDFELLGFHKRQALDIAVKTSWRKNAQEKVGILVLQGGRLTVVEYTEMGRNMEDPALANLGLYTLSLSFIKEASSFPMPLHAAKKVVKKWTPEGKQEFSKEPNAWKFEKFIFDAFVLANRFAALLFPRDECFAPLKNFEGEDSIEAVQAALLAFERKLYTRLTGVSVPSSVFELSPEFYYPTTSLRAEWQGKPLPEQKYIEAR